METGENIQNTNYKHEMYTYVFVFEKYNIWIDRYFAGNKSSLDQRPVSRDPPGLLSPDVIVGGEVTQLSFYSISL